MNKVTGIGKPYLLVPQNVPSNYVTVSKIVPKLHSIEEKNQALKWELTDFWLRLLCFGGRVTQITVSHWSSMFVSSKIIHFTTCSGARDDRKLSNNSQLI